MSTAQQELTVSTAHQGAPNEVVVYSHSPVIYWWPVWLVGYLMAIWTYFNGAEYAFKEDSVMIAEGKNAGVIFTVVLTLVFLMTNITVRGIASALVIAVILVLTLLFAWLGWWDEIFYYVSGLSIYMNMGFYVAFSTVVFVVWLSTTFIFDRLTYWTFRPGQMVYNRVWGGAERTFDTHGMSVYKQRDDLFRHWILGLGSGDMHIGTTGAESRAFDLKNVMFIGSKLDTVQTLVAMKPDDASDMTSVTAGGPE